MLLEVFATIICVVTCYGYPSLVFTTTKDVRVANMSRPNKAPPFIKELEGGAGVDFYLKGNLICWADHEVEAIQCAQFNDSGHNPNPKKITVVSNDITFPDGLACDWLTQKLYWTDVDTSRLEVVSMDGLYRKILFWEDIDQPRAIALVPTESTMFWTDWGEVPKIERASMDGDLSSRKVIVSEGIFWPNGLTADFEKRQLFWVDGKLKFIEVMDYDGKNRQIVTDKLVVYPYALTMFRDKLYWTDWNISCVYTLDLASGEHREMVSSDDAVPIDIKVMDRSRQPEAETGCSLRPNGGCSHLCLLSSVAPAGYTCACPTGIKLVDNYTCANGPQELLLLAQTREICTISLDSPDHTCVQIPLKGIKYAIDITYDPVHGFIYWTDEVAGLISRARLDGSQQEVVVSSDLVSPDGLAVDWRAGNLYWIDAGTDRIQVLRINTTYTKVLINSELAEPRSIAVSPDEGLMFWSDWSERAPKLERAALDGSMRDILVRDRLGWPNGITLDIDNRRLYWCDAKTEKIEMITYDGRDRREVVTDNLPHVFGLTLSGDYLYWTDWQRRSIESAHKTKATNRTVILDQTANMMGLKAVFPLKKSTNLNPCAVNNGNCAHLCLKTPNRYVCTCQMGYEVDSNGRKCVVPEAFLLFARKDNIGRISIENRQNDAIIPASGIKDASSLNFDISDNRIYWTDVKAKAITRAYINGSHVEKVIEFGLESPEGLAVDWVAGNMYWTDTGTRRIEVSRLDGWYRRAIIWTDIIEPRSIAVDPFQGYIYWSDWGGWGSVNRSRLDGSQTRPVVGRVGRANSLALDLAERRIYWCAVQGFIESAALDGSARRTVTTSPRPFTMSLYQDKIYWSDWSTGGIYSANKHVGSNQTLVHSRLEQVTSIVVYHDWGGRKRGDGSACHAACPALCLGRCACPTHYTLSSQDNTCLPPQSFLLLSTKNTVRRLIFNSSECPDTPLPVHGLKNVRAVDYDPLQHTLYWIDGGKSHSVRRWRVESSGSSGGGRPAPTVVGAERAFSLAVEPVFRLLYWSCPSEGVINATRLGNTSSPPAIIIKSHETERPRHIAVHSALRLLVYVSGGRETRLYVCRLDGSKKRPLVGSLSSSVSSLTIDPQHSTVYWLTADTIESIDIHGNRRREVVKDNLSKASELVLLGPSLYWVQGSKVVGYNRHTGKTRTAFNSHYHISTLTAVSPIAADLHHQATIEGWECAGGERTESPAECSDAGKTCPNDLFACAGSPGDCVSPQWRCDGVADCPDASDEAACPPCPPGTFTCAHHQCIENQLVCDGVEHCKDGSDERDCCGGHECGGLCVALEAVCDGWAHCADRSDEAPAACESAAKRAAAKRTPARPLSPLLPLPLVLVLCAFVVVGLFVVGFAVYKSRFMRCCNQKPGQVVDPALAPLSPVCSSGGYRGPLKGSIGTGGIRMSGLVGGGSSSGGGGSSALFYPVGPPPSPATTLARPVLYRPPPPTPCSTDVAHDTDSNYHGDSEPLPPPPTPTSLSPSSSTYFNPAPPPPSPTP